jgi:hypothetical protein
LTLEAFFDTNKDKVLHFGPSSAWYARSGKLSYILNDVIDKQLTSYFTIYSTDYIIYYLRNGHTFTLSIIEKNEKISLIFTDAHNTALATSYDKYEWVDKQI